MDPVGGKSGQVEGEIIETLPTFETGISRGHGQGRNEGGKEGAIPQAPSNYRGGYKSLREAPNGCGGRRKVPVMSQVLSSRRQACFFLRAPSNLVTPLATDPDLRSRLRHEHAFYFGPGAGVKTFRETGPGATFSYR